MTYGITNAGGGKSADLGTKTITVNDTYLASDDGLDGYSEVTVNVPATAPVLQNKIARQNGTVTADSGYDGLGEVDVGVGQIGTAYSCANKSGGSYATNDKVWLNYKQTTPQRTDSLASGTTGTQSVRGLYMTFDGSTVGVNGYASDSVSKYTISAGSAPVSATGFSWSYQLGDDFFIENTTTYVSAAEGSTTLSLGNEAVNTLDYKYLGGGLYTDGSNVREVASGDSLYVLPQYYKARMAKKLADNNYVVIIFNSNGGGYYRCVIDNGVATLSSSLSLYVSSGNYDKFNGFTSDGKYLITGNVSVMVDIENWSLATFKANFPNQTSWTLGYFNSVGDLFTYNGTDGYLHTFKYDIVSKDWTEVTELKVQTSGTCGVANYDGSILLYTTDTNGPNGNAVMQVAQNEGWVATQYGNINSDSLTGYAAANIAAGATGNVIVGTRVDGTAITATNNSSYARENGEKVWLYANNGSYSIVDALGLTSNAFTGVCKEAIAIGASGAVEATVGGELVVRWTSNFSTQGSVTIDDAAKLLTSTNTNNYIYKSDAISNIPSKLVFQLKYKLLSISNTSSNYYLFATTSETPVISATCFGLGYKSYDPSDTGYGGWYPVAIMGGDSIDTPRYSSFNSVPINTWVWIKATFNNGNVTLQCSLDGETWETVKSGTYTKTPVCSGYFLRGMECASSGVVYDLDKCYVEYDDQIVWQPYKAITE